VGYEEMAIGDIMTPRQVAYNALLKGYRQQAFLDVTLDSSDLEGRDRRLAQEIAFGTMRMTLALDHLAKQLSTTGKLKLKLKDKILLRMALYQHHYMAKIPIHAIVHETIEIAKRECHPQSTRFLNAALRKMEEIKAHLPDDLSIRYSFPKYFVDKLQKLHGEQTEELLKELNKAPKVVARKVGVFPLEFDSISDPATVASSSDLYIQNPTPANLLYSTVKDLNATSILDMCAAPGGKTILLHDLFPDAHLVANDLSENKRDRMEENFHRLKISPTITHYAGEEYPKEKLFDLIVIDAPCSNTGVLHKRPEARWRLSKETTKDLVDLQLSLLKRALSLLTPTGHLVYLTCSILPDENEEIVESLCKEKMVRCKTQRTILPQNDLDGGFAALIYRS
jgi:16S rRNA (cytosine967-C5)-methyltransferase